jgi:hypothetical protein
LPVVRWLFEPSAQSDAGHVIEEGDERAVTGKPQVEGAVANVPPGREQFDGAHQPTLLLAHAGFTLENSPDGSVASTASPYEHFANLYLKLNVG